MVVVSYFERGREGSGCSVHSTFYGLELSSRLSWGNLLCPSEIVVNRRAYFNAKRIYLELFKFFDDSCY